MSDVDTRKVRYLTSHCSCSLLGSQMTPSRGWESQPLRSKKLQALLLLIAGVRVWLGCVLESGRGCQPPFPAGGLAADLAKSKGKGKGKEGAPAPAQAPAPAAAASSSTSAGVGAKRARGERRPWSE